MAEPLAVPAAEVQRRFALYQDKALTQPVAVTSRGRPRVVMISVEEYERLR
ncbi:type II toxin-antitoxin system prevent-host-death family antitoxin, partial [Roseomonas chloroacetimidivorans]